MYKGFYNLTSGMLTQGRNLDVVANNMTNVSTAGFKADRYVSSTFKDALISRVGNKDKSNPVPIGQESYIRASSAVVTDYEQGSFDETGLPLNFAIEGDGFFAVQTQDGKAYTRCGNFALDQEGYLCLPGQGRILDSSGQPIPLGTDKFSADANGRIFAENGGYWGQLGVFSVQDPATLTRNAQGLFTSNTELPATASTVHWKMLERSNVDVMQQMMEMIQSQRALQSAAQVSKMYDQLMTKATNDIGRL